ncbi:MAG: site-2 protease family protein [Clostridia bacterium]
MLYSSIKTLISGGSVDFEMMVAQIVSVLFIIFFILPLHEFAHGIVAYKLGDPTPKYDKRLTINPLASVDPVGALALLLFSFGWAKPVQVNPRNFKNPKRDMAIVALAGPVSNLLAALVGACIFVPVVIFAPTNAVTEFLIMFFQYYIIINISLAVFNLIPIPPLDGSRIIAAFLSDRAMYQYYSLQRYFYMIFFVLMLSGTLSTPLSIAQNFFYDIIINIALFPYQLLGIIG